MGLLLRVITHDLLSPLTAIKWNAELLEGRGMKAKNATERMKTMRESAALGINITKRISVAGRLLAEQYVPDPIPLKLEDVVAEAATDLMPQFERHALTLLADVRQSGSESTYDRELVALCIWSQAKYFLTCCASGSTTTVTAAPGIVGVPEALVSVPHYQISLHSDTVADAHDRVALFDQDEVQGAFDQSLVFSHLVRKSTAELHGACRARADGSTFSITVALPL